MYQFTPSPEIIPLVPSVSCYSHRTRHRYCLSWIIALLKEGWGQHAALSKAGDTVNIVYAFSFTELAPFNNQPSSAKYGMGHLSMIHSINAACQMGVCRVFCCKTVAILCPSRPCPPRKRSDRALARPGFWLAWMVRYRVEGKAVHLTSKPKRLSGSEKNQGDLAIIP